MAAKRKKTILLDPELVETVRRFYGVRTETEAITRALQDIGHRQEHLDFIQALRKAGPFDRSRI